MLKKSLYAIEVIAVIFISLFLIATLLQRVLPEKDGIFGYKTFVIVSGSMEPKLSIGDVIVVKTTEPEDVKTTDIITYKGLSGTFQDKIVTHQVIGIQEEGKRYIFYTKGLENDFEDPAVYEEQVYGVMIHKFWFFSIVSKIVRSKFGFFGLILIPAIFLVYFEAKTIIGELKERRK